MSDLLPSIFSLLQNLCSFSPEFNMNENTNSLVNRKCDAAWYTFSTLHQGLDVQFLLL